MGISTRCLTRPCKGKAEAKKQSRQHKANQEVREPTKNCFLPRAKVSDCLGDPSDKESNPVKVKNQGTNASSILSYKGRGSPNEAGPRTRSLTVHHCIPDRHNCQGVSQLGSQQQPPNIRQEALRNAPPDSSITTNDKWV